MYNYTRRQKKKRKTSLGGILSIYPIKFITIKCKITWAKIKSANPRSGDIPTNTLLFCGFACNRKHTPSTKQLNALIKPARKELNGNVPTRQQ